MLLINPIICIFIRRSSNSVTIDFFFFGQVTIEIYTKFIRKVFNNYRSNLILKHYQVDLNHVYGLILVWYGDRKTEGNSSVIQNSLK